MFQLATAPIRFRNGKLRKSLLILADMVVTVSQDRAPRFSLNQAKKIVPTDNSIKGIHLEQ